MKDKNAHVQDAYRASLVRARARARVCVCLFNSNFKKLLSVKCSIPYWMNLPITSLLLLVLVLLLVVLSNLK